MSRHHSSRAQSPRLTHLAPDFWRMSWVVDYYYPGSRLRHPRTFTRYTDDAGAVRFAKRWNIHFVRPPY